jgi:hypothetical protein
MQSRPPGGPSHIRERQAATYRAREILPAEPP